MTNPPWGQPSAVPVGPGPHYPNLFGAPLANRPPVLPPGRVGIGGLFRATWEVCKRKGLLLLGISLVSALVAVVIMFFPAVIVIMLGVFSLIAGYEDRKYDPRPVLTVVIPAILVCATLMGAVAVWLWARFTSMMVAVVDQTVRGFDATWNSAENQTRDATGRAGTLIMIGAALGFGLGAMLSVLFVTITAGDHWLSDTAVLVTVGLFLTALLIGLYLQIRLVYSLQALSLEGHRGLGVLRRSLALTSRRFWGTLGLLIVGGALPYLLNTMVNFTNEAIRDNQDLAPLAVVTGLLGLALNFLVAVWTTIWQTLMYVDVRRFEQGGPGVAVPQPMPVQPQWPTPGYPEPRAPMAPEPPMAPPPPVAPPAPGILDDSSPWARRDGEGF